MPSAGTIDNGCPASQTCSPPCAAVVITHDLGETPLFQRVGMILHNITRRKQLPRLPQRVDDEHIAIAIAAAVTDPHGEAIGAGAGRRIRESKILNASQPRTD